MQQISQWFTKRKQAEKGTGPKIIPRSEHIISRANISQNAIKVLNRLNKAGFAAYLVGGGVRDLLLGLKPKDFDIATDAHPEQIQELFRNCRLIGRRFRLAHIYFKDNVVEVATFRAQEDSGSGERHKTETGMLLSDNVYGTLEDDAWRRDFTMNALYYNIADLSVVDYVDGMSDLAQRIVRVIGDPVQRYHEDPVRMLRAVRLAAKLDFTIESGSEKPIFELCGLLQNIPPARLYEEIVKIFMGGKSLATFKLLRHYGLFSMLFPQAEATLIGAQGKIFESLLVFAFAHADERLMQDKTLNPAFLFAVILWAPLQKTLPSLQSKNTPLFPAAFLAVEKVLRQQNKSMSIPRRLTLVMREIWLLQYRLEQRRRPNNVMRHPRFRAAFDFLTLRAEAGEPLHEIAKWWADYQNADDVEKQNLINQLAPKNKRGPNK